MVGGGLCEAGQMIGIYTLSGKLGSSESIYGGKPSIALVRKVGAAMKIRQGKQSRARRVMIYGDNGIGKSTWAASWPKALVLNVEDGVCGIDCDSTERIKDFGGYLSAISWVIQNPNDYQTVVTDTADWVEKLIFKVVAEEFGKKTIEEIGFGKGYEAVERNWRRVIDGMTMLWESGRHIIFTCHSKIAKFKSPEGESYDYYSPAIHDKGSDILQQWCDEVLLAKYRIVTRSVDEGFGSKRNIAMGGTERIICTQEAPSHVAKNRLDLPAEIGMNFTEFAPHIGNIQGLVVSGSSKRKVQNDG